MIRKKSREQLLREMLAGIVQETSITMVGKGSVTRGLASAFSGTIEQVYQVLDDAIVNSFLPTASGFYLDLFGGSFGLPRRQPVSAAISRTDRSIKFYVNNGNLADVLPHPTDSALGRVPSGTTITTSTGLTYTVDADYDFPAAAKETFVGATSSGTGSSQNVGAGALNQTTLPGVQVTNITNISTGTDLESDEEYRFRISRWVRSSAGRNEVAVRLAVLSAPGIADMIKEPFFAGAGSFRIIVIPTGNRVPIESIRLIYSNLSSVASDGTFYIVEEPRYIPVSISVRLVPVENSVITATDRNLAEQAILRYLGDIRPNDQLIINRIRTIVLSASNNIGDLRIQNLSINRRPRALTNFRLKRDELFVPDEELDDPILVV